VVESALAGRDFIEPADSVMRADPLDSTGSSFPGADPLVPFALAPSLLDEYVAFGRVEPSYDDLTAILGPLTTVPVVFSRLARPRLALQGATAFLSGGRPDFLTCAEIEVAPGLLAPCATLWVGEVLAPGRPNLSPLVNVPGQVVDLASLPDGRVLVLSQVYDASDDPVASVVTAVRPGGGLGYGYVTEILGTFRGEWLQGGFSRDAGGGLTFLSLILPDAPGPVRSVIHLWDGYDLIPLQDPTYPLDLGARTADGELGILKRVRLSPDGSRLVVDDAWLGPPYGPFRETVLVSSRSGNEDDEGQAWPEGGVATWTGASPYRPTIDPVDLGAVDLHDAAPPYALRFYYLVTSLPGAHRPTQLIGAVAVGDRLVLTTTSGVRILGPDGTLLGGADPLPCGLSPTSVAAQVGPTTAAVGAGTHVFTFDVFAP